MSRKYIPQPADTNHINLPKELNSLVEEMAKNVHEVWAKSRMDQGWRYGSECNDILKQVMLPKVSFLRFHHDIRQDTSYLETMCHQLKD